MKYVLVHGIGNTKAGWSKGLHEELGCYPDDIVEFNWEDNIQRTKIDKLTSFFQKGWLGKRLFDYGGDVVRYFTEPRLRRSIVDELFYQLDLLNEPFVLIGFSLGSVIALEALNEGLLECKQLVTIGSPIGQPVVKKLVKHPKEVLDRNFVWMNGWSNDDLVSAPIDISYAKPRNIAYTCTHTIKCHLTHIRPLIMKG